MSVFVASAPGSPLSAVQMKGSCALSPGERERTGSWTQPTLASTSRRTVAWRMCLSVAERLAGGYERPDPTGLQPGDNSAVENTVCRSQIGLGRPWGSVYAHHPFPLRRDAHSARDRSVRLDQRNACTSRI